MKQKELHKLAKEPDAFLTLSDKLLHWIERQRKPIGVILGIFLITGLAMMGYNYSLSTKEAHAVADIYKYEAEMNRKKEELAKAEDEKNKPAATGKKNEKPKISPAPAPTPVDFVAQFGAIAQKLEGAILANKHTKAAVVAAVQLTGLYIEHKQFDLAKSLVEKMSNESSELAGGLFQIQKATVLLDHQDFEAAAQMFEQIVNNKIYDYLHPQALLRLGICYEKLGRLDRARELYMRVSTDYPESEASQSAKFYLRLLTLNTEKPAKAG